MVETPCSWSAHRGLITGKSQCQWTRHTALQLSPWSSHLVVGQCSDGDEWQIPVSDRDTLQLVRVQRGRVASNSGRDTLQLVRVLRGRVASHSGRDTLQLVSAAGTSRKPQWQRHLAKRNPLHHQYHLHGHPQTPSTGLRHPSRSTTAVFSYATGSRKLSANEQFFVGAQTVVSLLQTTQTKQGVSFIAANKVYFSANKTTIV